MSPRVTLDPGLDSEKSLAMMDPILPDPRTMTFMGFDRGLMWWFGFFTVSMSGGNYLRLDAASFMRVGFGHRSIRLRSQCGEEPDG